MPRKRRRSREIKFERYRGTVVLQRGTVVEAVRATTVDTPRLPFSVSVPRNAILSFSRPCLSRILYYRRSLFLPADAADARGVLSLGRSGPRS